MSVRACGWVGMQGRMMACDGVSGHAREGMCTSAFEGGGRGHAWVCVHACVVIVLREGVARAVTIRHQT